MSEHTVDEPRDQWEDPYDEDYSWEMQDDYNARQEAMWDEMDEIDRTGRW